MYRVAGLLPYSGQLFGYVVLNQNALPHFGQVRCDIRGSTLSVPMRNGVAVRARDVEFSVRQLDGAALHHGVSILQRRAEK